MDKAQRIQAEIKKVFGDAPVNLVGGSVRDIILGNEPKDWDYCTPLDPDAIEDAIRKAGRKPYLIGKRFGTVGFKVSIGSEMDINLNGQDLDSEDFDANNVTFSQPKEIWVYIEVTTYRTEKYDGKSRKPNVEFSDDLMLDLSRRDFTINSIVLQEDGNFFDPHGGRLDILAKKIKAVGVGKDRILEDPLRILRAARFAARLGFEVDPNLMGVMRQHSHEIARVSKERWVMELDKLLDSKDPQSGLEVLYKADILKFVLPEVHLAFKHDANWIIDCSYGIQQAKTVDEKWKALLVPIGVPYSEEKVKGELRYPRHENVRKELIQGICLRLKFSNERTKCLVQ